MFPVLSPPRSTPLNLGPHLLTSWDGVLHSGYDQHAQGDETMMILEPDPRVTPELIAAYLAEHDIDPARYRTKNEDVVAGDKVLVSRAYGHSRFICTVLRTTKTQITVDVPYGTETQPERFSRRSEWNRDMTIIGSGTRYYKMTAREIDEDTVISEISRALNVTADEARQDARRRIDAASKALTAAVHQLDGVDDIKEFVGKLETLNLEAEATLAVQTEAEDAAREARMAR